ncbi:MAG TPA: hypothetical protein VN851_17520 [Thermoanaerobaculia bacterium]|nr:hypothetical protein [Thermoanaerobaculia bacterium]
MVDKDAVQGIWLEVAEVRCDSQATGQVCKVRLKGDRGEDPKTWWPVAPEILGSKEPDSVFAVYKAILTELDKKRVVTMELRWQKNHLECQALRFLSAEAGAR